MKIKQLEELQSKQEELLKLAKKAPLLAKAKYAEAASELQVKINKLNLQILQDLT